MSWPEFLGALTFVLTAYVLGFTRGYTRGACQAAAQCDGSQGEGGEG